MGQPVRIENVSDTALWVAHGRAQEGQRPNAIFKDPLSATLAGDRGRELAKHMRFGAIMNWVMVLRTSAIDRLILQLVHEGVDTIINLGAGLDTRPYRMRLPAELNWFEVDFPNLIESKNQVLTQETPICHLERIALDLTDRKATQNLWARLSQTGRRVAILTEGVLPYLTNDQVSALASDLLANSNFEFWIQDFYQKGFPAMAGNAWKDKFKDAPLQFKVDNWLTYFVSQGWKARQVISINEEASRVHRAPPFIFPWSLLFMLLPKAKKEKWGKSSGYVLMERIRPVTD